MTLLIKQELKKRQQFNDDDYPLIEVKHLSITFRQFQRGLRETSLTVINRFDLSINKGEIVAVVGASGSGKSLLADAILGILPDHAHMSGEINFEGNALTGKVQEYARGKEISLIPQSINALDPLMKSGKQVESVIRSKDKKAAVNRVFQKVGLAPGTEQLYPFELSGGMARRVLVSTAIVSEAKLLIADEPTPGLDEYNLTETLHYMKGLANEGKGIMFITHDLMTAREIADKIIVCYAGETIETADPKDFIGKGERLKHPYTRALWNALPQNGFHSLVEHSDLSSS